MKPTEDKCVMVMPDASDAADTDGAAGALPLSRDQILNVQDLSVQVVPVPEWGGTVCIRSISAGDWDDFENSLVTIEDGVTKKADLADYRARFAAIVICDEDGKKLFSAGDIPALSGKSRAALDRVLEAGKKFNRISDGDEEAIVADLRPAPDGDS